MSGAFSFEPGSTIVPRRKRQPIRNESVPSLSSSIATLPSNDSIIQTPTLSSSELPVVGPDVVSPEIGIGEVYPLRLQGLRRQSEGREAGLWPKGCYRVPHPESSFGYQERSLDNGTEFIREEEALAFVLIDERYGGHRVPDLPPIPRVAPDAAVGESLDYHSPKWCRTERPKVKAGKEVKEGYEIRWGELIEAVYGERLDKLHYRKETLQIGARKAVAKVKSVGRAVVDVVRR